MSRHLSAFEKSPRAEGKSPSTIRGYLSDTRGFVRWFEETTGEPFNPGAITSLDVHSYRSHLLKDKGCKPATVNRKLSSLCAFCRWARKAGLRRDDPTGEVSGVQEVRPAPKALSHRQLLRLLRVGLVTVTTLMGHRSLDTTAIYTQPSEADPVRVAEKSSST